MATCLETVTAGCSSVDRGNENNHGFGDCFSYKRLTVVINNSDFVILGLYLLIFGSNSVCHDITTVETGLVCLVALTQGQRETNRRPNCGLLAHFSSRKYIIN